MRHSAALTAAALPLLLLVACGGSAPPQPRAPAGGQATPSAPLDRAYVLMPTPSDDDTLLGKVLVELPSAGQSLTDVARPNPCADKLTEAKTSPSTGSFEDAQELSVGAGARAALSPYGFQDDAEHATHFFYKLDTSKEAARTETNDYAACCKANDCGFGYVSALVYGDGQYTAAEETEGQPDLVVEAVQGSVRLHVLHTRKVHGYVAAAVTVTNAAKAHGSLGVLGTAQAPRTKQADDEKLVVADIRDATTYTIKDGRGVAITENEFVRLYKSVTGSDELADYDRNRRPGWYTGSAILGVGGLGVLVTGIILLQTPQGFCSGAAICNGAGAAGLMSTMLGAFAVTGAAIWFGVGVSQSDGVAHEDHFLSDAEAQVYVARYNRALLRKRGRSTPKGNRDRASVQPTRSVTVLPWLGLGSAGIQGRF